ncbi:DUF2911 domain-containing protein [Longimicrobium sp.]|uniref:DUF2911 domain-containing protein n=1 Tax=Longimicrobium sp. TaxID=2029185 RepID=UPI002E319ADC|nr:DUF2911 domain-containing protein [Longimicrobium sp.]HEX6040404.1 DUF2911 domain-containing protein [Longimicrobium sp.]
MIPHPGRIALAALALSLAAAPAAAQESGAYVIRLGRDTVVVDQFTRSATRIEGTLVGRTPRTSIRTYSAELRPDGSIASLRMETRIPSAPELLPQVITMTMGAPTADSASVRIVRGDTVREVKVAAGPDVAPWVFNAYGLAEPVIRAAAARGLDSAAVTVLSPGAPRTGSVSFIRQGADSLLIRSANGVTRARVDRNGRVLGANSPESTFKAEIERVDRADVQAIAADWARRDQAGQQMGTLSPRDSVTSTIGGATVNVAYGRPSMRGRRVMGQVVPFGEVWRTGANEATAFRTDRDVMIDGTRVPAGSYTLWTVPAADGWTLIVNRQTGQWGTVYDAAQDLARIPVRIETASGAPVEMLTMRFEPSSGGSSLVIAWENTRVLVPITAAP